MSDEPKHTTQTNEILQSSALIQRLDRRRTHPSGLINTRQSQRSLPRLPATMVQRFALLEQIQTRYGVSNNSSGIGTELTFATRAPKTTGEQTNTFTSEAAMPAASFANAQPGTSTLSSASNQAPAAKFRISRKAVPSGSESFPSKANSEPLSSPTELASPLVMRKATATSEDLKEEIQQQPILRAKPLANNIQSPTQAFSSAQAEANIPLVMRKATTENLEEEVQLQPYLRAKPLANNIQSPTQAFSSAQAGANTPLVLRKATTENLEEESQPQPERVALSREITRNVVSQPQSTMVLRQSPQVAVMGNNFSQASNGGTNDSFPLPITPVHHNALARQTAPSHTSRTMPMSNTTMSMPRQGSMPIPEINLAEIAEQVSRILCHQLTVERERRGIRK